MHGDWQSISTAVRVYVTGTKPDLYPKSLLLILILYKFIINSILKQSSEVSVTL